MVRHPLVVDFGQTLSASTELKVNDSINGGPFGPKDNHQTKHFCEYATHRPINPHVKKSSLELIG